MGRSEQELQVKSRETYILLDVSASMNTEDLQPSRIGKVKSELLKYMDQMKGDRIGLIVFTSNAYVQCPLTEDHSALKLYLDIAGSGSLLIPEPISDLRSLWPITVLSDREKDRPNMSKSIILISDGEHFGDSYESVIDRLLEYEIKVFPVEWVPIKGARFPVMWMERRTDFFRIEMAV